MKRTKTFKHTIKYSWDRQEYHHNLYLVADNYQADGSLAIIVMEEKENGEDEQFDVITVCLPWGCADESHAYIDTNNCSWAEKMLRQHRIAKDTDIWERSGYCTYPLYEFNLAKFYETE